MKILSNWRSVRLWESQLERDLHRDYNLRTHGLLIGSAMLLLMWAVSALLMHFGTHSLAARYAFTLGVGYLGYLALLRWWAQRLVEGRTQVNPDVPDPSDFGLDGVHEVASNGSLLSDAASGALDVAAAADDGAIVVVPVVAIFLIVVAIVFGAGWLTLLYFGWDTLLAVAVEVAFSYVGACRRARGTRGLAVGRSQADLEAAARCVAVRRAARRHHRPFHATGALAS